MELYLFAVGKQLHLPRISFACRYPVELVIVESSGGKGSTSFCGMRLVTLDCGITDVVVSLGERG